MHDLPSRSAVTRFRLVSWMLVLLWLLIPSTLGVLIYSSLVTEAKLGNLVLGLNVATVMLVIIQWPLSADAHCPLCHGQSIGRRGSSRHRNAKSLFGS